MKVIFLGTNGWYHTETGNTICTFLETNDYYFVLDAGNGLYKIEEHIKDSDKPIYLFLSHFHLDYIEGLHILNKFNFKNNFQIYGQRGTQKILDNIINQPYTVPFAELPFEVEIHEIEEGINNIPFKIECKFLPHALPCLGYRFNIDGKVIAYCTDTGPHENVEKLANDADLLITEVSPQNRRQLSWMAPSKSSRRCKNCFKGQNEKISLTHFDANIYRSTEERQESKKVMKKLFRYNIHQ